MMARWFSLLAAVLLVLAAPAPAAAAARHSCCCQEACACEQDGLLSGCGCPAPSEVPVLPPAPLETVQAPARAPRDLPRATSLPQLPPLPPRVPRDAPEVKHLRPAQVALPPPAC